MAVSALRFCALASAALAAAALPAPAPAAAALAELLAPAAAGLGAAAAAARELQGGSIQPLSYCSQSIPVSQQYPCAMLGTGKTIINNIEITCECAPRPLSAAAARARRHSRLPPRRRAARNARPRSRGIGGADHA